MNGEDALLEDAGKGGPGLAGGVPEGKEYVCEKYGETVLASDDLSCLHPKEKCKFRLTCPIYAIGKNR